MIARCIGKRLFAIHEAKKENEIPFFLQSDKIVMRSQRAVPVGSTTRLASFGSLGASLVGTTIAEAVKQSLGLSKPVDQTYTGIKKYVVSQATADKLADSLCKMRGAVLKIGQVISTFEDNIVPPLIKKALERARAQADFLPNDQLLEALAEAYGTNWQDNFSSFNLNPIAAASIGQVHEAVLKKGNQHVAIKIQYPGIADSVDQDINNFKRIANLAHLFPKSFFIDDILEGIRIEFKEECDYLKEADKLKKYKEMLKNKEEYLVPDVYDEFTTKKILCMDFVEGTPIDELIDDSTPQETRNFIGKALLDLYPNPANFLFNKKTNKLVLIDLGAGKFFDSKFVDQYMGIVYGAANNDKAQILDYSKSMGLITGEENRKLITAHINSALIIGEGFTQKGEPEYDFSSQEITTKVFS